MSSRLVTGSIVAFVASLLCLILGASSLRGQDLSIPDNPYDAADEATKQRKAFLRERWFYEQRMYPFNRLPDDAYGKAMRQRDEMRQMQGFRENLVTWTNLGPTSGYYFSYGNISGRTATIKYDPNNPNVLYIGAAFGGVWKTTNSGTTWTVKTDFEPSLASGALAIDPSNSNIIYYGTGEATYSSVSYYGRGLLKSTDGGNTWTNYTSGLESYTYFSRIVVRPNNPSHLLAALGNRSSPSATGGIYRSTNGGASWSVVVSGRADDIVFSPSGDTAYAVGSGVGYRISTNGGQTFTSSSALTMQTRNHIAICKSNPSILYAATYSGSTILVFKSTDAGTSFTQVAVGTNFNGGQAWYDFYIHVNPFDPNYVYVGSIDIWRSTNGGTSFQNITNGYSGGNVHVDQHNVDFHPTDSNQMFCVNDGGVWRSTDRGTTWTNLNSPLTLTQFYRITADPSNAAHILGGTQDNGTQRTTGAMNWAAAFGGDGGEVCFHSQNPSLILGETQYNGIYRSTNGGASWASSTSGLSGTAAWVAPIISHPDSANIFYTARQSVFKSTNGGASWFSISTGISGTIREMAISTSDPQIMFATIGSAVYKSMNRGYNWSLTSSGLPSRTITRVFIHPDSSNVVLLSFSGFGAGKVYRSSNTGTTWVDISGNLPDTPVNDVLIYPATGTYLVGTDVGVFITENFGATWTELADGLPNTVAIHLDYHAATGKLRVGTHGRGVYETMLGQAAIAVTSPNGGENWPIGTTQAIQWNSSLITGNVKIELSRSGGATFNEVLFASTMNDGSENWTVAGQVTSQARIRISSVSDPNVADTSNANFNIVQLAVTVLVPNGGETWQGGSIQSIEWNSGFVPGDVKVELSRNGGETFSEVLFASIPNSGSANWVVTGPATFRGRIRISSIAYPTVADTSNDYFTVIDPAVYFLARIALQDNGGGRDTLEFGTGSGGTDGIDPLFGEFELPPAPPLGVFDVRWQIAGTQGSLRDVRDTLGGSRSQIDYIGRLQASEGGYPFRLRWNPLQLSNDLLIMRAGSYSIDMHAQDTVVISDGDINTFRIEYIEAASASLAVVQGWNLMSLPLRMLDRRKTVVFPTAVSDAFTFSNGYVLRDTLEYGKGYWIKFGSPQVLELDGGRIALDSVVVTAGWNLIGSISAIVQVGDIVQVPPGIVVSPYYEFTGGSYQIATTIEPMKGYWVKVNQNGKLVLISNSSSKSTKISRPSTDPTVQGESIK
jgi:hypothetical protein